MKDYKLKISNVKFTVAIIFFIIMFVLAIAFTVIFIFKNNASTNSSVTEKKKEKDVIDSYIEKNLSFLFTKEEIESMSYEQKQKLYFGTSNNESKLTSEKYNDNNSSNKKSTNINLETLKSKYYSFMGKANFDELIKDYESLENNYNLEDEKYLDILLMYEASCTMHNVSIIDDDITKAVLVDTIREPGSYLICSLLIGEKARRNLILDLNSLSPVFDGSIDIVSVNLISNDDAQSLTSTDTEILDSISSNSSISYVNDVYKIKFTIEDNILTSYIVRSANSSCKIYGIYSDDPNIKYQPLSFWVDKNY